MSQLEYSEALVSPVLDSVQSRISFLENLLEGKLPVLEIPTDRSRAKIEDFSTSSQALLLPTDLVELINNISHKEKVSLNCILLTTFQILLHRYTNQTEIVIGTPLKNNNALLKNRFDIFQNIDLLPLRLNHHSSFSKLIHTLQITLDAQANHKLAVNTDLATVLLENTKNSTLFQVLFEFETAGASKKDSNWDILKLDLSLKIIEQPQGLECVFTYNSNLFAASTIARMLGHFQILLESVVANPEQSIVTLELLTSAEKEQILSTWNDTQADYPEVCIHQLFEQQVAKTPDAIALVFEEQQLTYQELNQKANSLAHHLRAMGVKAETLVGICVDRSVEMIVGILGVLKAGGAYVPLDHSYPVERIGYMLEDAQATVLLTQESLNLEQLLNNFVPASTQIVTLEQFTREIVPETSQNLTNTVAPHNLAYVIYTSGSTGKPKGVQIEHHTAVNLLISMTHRPGIKASDTLLSVTTISFDISIVEIFIPLIVGAKLVVVSNQVARNGYQLSQAVLTSQATLMQATPVSWKMLLAAGWQGSKDLKILSGGEALSKELAQQLMDKDASVWNLYGPTETTIWSSVYQVESDRDISIGRPVANVKYYILDEHLIPLPIGIPGELYIGGNCLARGYFNRPELTAARFIPDPFSNSPEARMYKTGDLASYSPDGKVMCLGRLDRQVKIRGFRIEVEEIESAILQYPGVQAVAVVVQANMSGYQRLVGYLVNQSEGEVETEALRCYLKQQLPSHMIPCGFMTIEALPLTLNGKVDPKALPPFDFVNQGTGESYVAPCSELETQLASVWSKVLEIERVGIKDDFMELGGNSLLTITLVKEIEQALNQKIPLQALSNLTTIEQMARCFEAGQPTVEDLATIPDGINPQDYQALISIMAGRKGDRPRPNSLMVALQNQGSKPPLFFCANGYDEAAPLVNYLGEERPFYLMESGHFTLDCTNRQIKALATHHLEDILTVQPEPPYLLAGYSTGGLIALEIAQQLREMGKEVALLAILDTAGSHPLYQNYLNLNYVLRSNWDRLTALIGGTKSNPSRAETPSKTQAQFSGNKLNSDPYIIQSYQGKMILFLPIKGDRNFFFSHKIKFLICPRGGWDNKTVRQLKIERVPGNHFNMLKEPHVRALGKKLKQYCSKNF